ncbi:MAG: hypothetical protein K5839_05940 [Treponemataceae bacterium]|nr:hypothetical protein [Treponemataceae bacterium]
MKIKTEGQTELGRKEKLKKIFSPQNIGLFLAFVACIIFWLPIWKYDEVHGIWFLKKIHQKTLDLKPGILSGFIALFINFILYVRGILSYKNKWLGLVSFLINLTLTATLIEIFISPGRAEASINPFFQNFYAIIGSAVCLAIIIFGVKEIAKLVLFVFFIANFWANLKLVNDAMGFVGYINLLLVVSSVFLQQNINFPKMGQEFRYLFANNGSLSKKERRLLKKKSKSRLEKNILAEEASLRKRFSKSRSEFEDLPVDDYESADSEIEINELLDDYPSSEENPNGKLDQ